MQESGIEIHGDGFTEDEIIAVEFFSKESYRMIALSLERWIRHSLAERPFEFIRCNEDRRKECEKIGFCLIEGHKLLERRKQDVEYNKTEFDLVKDVEKEMKKDKSFELCVHYQIILNQGKPSIKKNVLAQHGRKVQQVNGDNKQADS